MIEVLYLSSSIFQNETSYVSFHLQGAAVRKVFLFVCLFVYKFKDSHRGFSTQVKAKENPTKNRNLPLCNWQLLAPGR